MRSTAIKKNKKSHTKREKTNEPIYRKQLISVLEKHESQKNKIEEYEEQLLERDVTIQNLNSQIDELKTRIVQLEDQLKQTEDDTANESCVSLQQTKKSNDEREEDNASSCDEEQYKNKTLKNLKSKGPSITSTPKQVKFQEGGAKIISIEELAENFTNLINRKTKNSTNEARKFQWELVKRVQKIERRHGENIKIIEDSKETITELKCKIAELTKANETIEKQLHSNYDTMNQVIRDQQQKIAEMVTEQGIQQNYKENQIPDEVETSRLELLNTIGENIAKKDKEIKTYTQATT